MSEEGKPLYEKLIYQNDEKAYQYRLVVSEFRDVQYIHIRKYFLSFEGEYVPSKEGASIAATINNTFALLDGLLEIVSHEEGQDAIKEYLEAKLKNVK